MAVPSGLQVLLGAPSLTSPVENSPVLLSSSFFPSAVFQIRKGKTSQRCQQPNSSRCSNETAPERRV